MISKHQNNEVNLGELIELLLKRKWLILGGSLACSMIVGIYTFLMPRQYQSEALILVSPSIVKPNSDSNNSAQVSEVSVSSLEASTYEVLAKSDELMIDLADKIIARLEPEVLETTFSTENNYVLAQSLVNNLEVELLQDTGLDNIPSTTPLLVMRYKSTEEVIAPIIVNTWSELFLRRNQGLSSNITDGFYQSIVLQYEQARNNLELKEDELIKLDSPSNELNRIKTEKNVMNTRLDTSLKSYQQLQSELKQKEEEYKSILLNKSDLEYNGLWLGYVSPDTLKYLNNRMSKVSNDIIKATLDLKKTSLNEQMVELETNEILANMKLDHQQRRLDFETSTGISYKKQQHEHFRSLDLLYVEELIKAENEIDKLKLSIAATQKTMDNLAPVLITRKAITDDGLWTHTSPSEKFDGRTQQLLSKYGLMSEETNPVYSKLSQELAENKAKLSFKKKRKKYLETSIDTLQILSTNLYLGLSELRKEELEFEKSLVKELSQIGEKNERVVTNARLQVSLARSTFDSYRQQYEAIRYREAVLKTELESLRIATLYNQENYISSRDQFVRLSVTVDSLELERRRMERATKIYTESFSRFSKLKEEARIARQQAAGDIQIVSTSKLTKSLPKNTIEKTFLSGLVSFLLLTTLCILSIYFKKYQKTQPL